MEDQLLKQQGSLDKAMSIMIEPDLLLLIRLKRIRQSVPKIKHGQNEFDSSALAPVVPAIKTRELGNVDQTGP